jgi:hypothetical protein
VVTRRYVEDIGIGGKFFFELRDNRAGFGETLGGDVALRQSEPRETAVVAGGECFAQFGDGRVALAGGGFYQS